jgi:C-methyltransferase C-terminal domain/Putative zinc binding domain/Methyltransferase domain
VRSVLDLGRVPLANGFVDPADADKPDPTYPLGIQFCSGCAIVQLTHTVDPDVLFRHYLYTPGASSTWLAHCQELALWLRQQVHGQDPFVVEPASNDGSLLRAIKSWTPDVLGIEPARNIAEKARREGIPTVCDFFGEATARAIRAERGPARVVVGTNVLAHVPDLIDFIRGAAALLEDGGIFVIEAPYLRDLVESLAYDTIYHEHVSYLSVTAIEHAYARAGLTLTHVERTPTHGGSIRFVGQHAGARREDSVDQFLADESQLGYADGSALLNFAERVDVLRQALADAVRAETTAGRAMAAYGATAKGNTLLTTCDVDRGAIRYVVDRNPLKQGLLTPGSHIPIFGPHQLEAEPVDVLLLLAWNLADEIVAQETAFAGRGGRFLVPIPEPHFVR